MNREDTIKAIAVMQAFVDGKEIVAVGSGNVCINPSWNWWNQRFAVKPREPTVCYRNEYPEGDINDLGNGFGASFDCEKHCERAAAHNALRKAVKFVEVVEE